MPSHSDLKERRTFFIIYTWCWYNTQHSPFVPISSVHWSPKETAVKLPGGFQVKQYAGHNHSVVDCAHLYYTIYTSLTSILYYPHHVAHQQYNQTWSLPTLLHIVHGSNILTATNQHFQFSSSQNVSTGWDFPFNILIVVFQQWLDSLIITCNVDCLRSTSTMLLLHYTFLWLWKVDHWILIWKHTCPHPQFIICMWW